MTRKKRPPTEPVINDASLITTSTFVDVYPFATSLRCCFDHSSEHAALVLTLDSDVVRRSYPRSQTLVELLGLCVKILGKFSRRLSRPRLGRYCCIGKHVTNFMLFYGLEGALVSQALLWPFCRDVVHSRARAPWRV